MLLKFSGSQWQFFLLNFFVNNTSCFQCEKSFKKIVHLFSYDSLWKGTVFFCLCLYLFHVFVYMYYVFWYFNGYWWIGRNIWILHFLLPFTLISFEWTCIGFNLSSHLYIVFCYCLKYYPFIVFLSKVS